MKIPAKNLLILHVAAAADGPVSLGRAVTALGDQFGLGMTDDAVYRGLSWLSQNALLQRHYSGQRDVPDEFTVTGLGLTYLATPVAVLSAGQLAAALGALDDAMWYRSDYDPDECADCGPVIRCLDHAGDDAKTGRYGKLAADLRRQL